MAPGHALGRFVAGRRDTLKVESAEFQQALRDFIRSCQVGGALELWLQGPQTLEELAILAEREGSVFPLGAAVASTGRESLLPLSGEELKLRLPGAPRLVLAFALDGMAGEGGALLEQLQGWLADEAPGSLLACLGQNGLADSARARLSRFADGQALLRFDFELAEASTADLVESAFLSWLEALRKLPADVLAAAPADGATGSLAQLQRRARSDASSVWLGQLVASRMIRLLASESVIGESLTSAGFILDVVRCAKRAAEPLRAEPWSFAPMQLPADSEPAALHLRWRFPQAPGRQAFLSARQVLRPLAGAARHEGVTLRLEALESDWALLLSGARNQLADLAECAINALQHPPAAVLGQGARLLAAERRRREGEMPIRQLIDLLPQVLAGTAKRCRTGRLLTGTPWPWVSSCRIPWPITRAPARCHRAAGRPAVTARCWRRRAKQRCCCSAHWCPARWRTKPRGACWRVCWSRLSSIGCAVNGSWLMRCTVVSAR